MAEKPIDPNSPNDVNNDNPNPRNTGEVDDWPVFPAPMTDWELKTARNLLETARKARLKDPDYRLIRPEDFPLELESHWIRLSLRRQAEVAARILRVYDLNQVDEFGEMRADHPIRQAWAFPPPLPPGPFDLSEFDTYGGPKISHYLESMIGTDKEEGPHDVWGKILSASASANPFPLEEQDLWMVLTGREGRIMLLLGPTNRIAPYFGGGSPCPILVQKQPNFFTVAGEAQFLGHLPNAPRLAGGAETMARLAIFWPAGEKLQSPARNSGCDLDC